LEVLVDRGSIPLTSTNFNIGLKMNACPYCRKYHLDWKVCDEYIKWLEKQINKDGGK